MRLESLSTTSARLVAVRLKSTNKHIFRALLSLASAALLIRVMGMLNQLVVSSHFGAGASMDAYVIASTTPMLLASLLENVIEASIIPVYARLRTQKTKDQASRFFSTLLNLLILGGILVTLLMLIFRSQLIFLTAPGSQSSIIGLAISLAPFIFPAFVLMIVIQYLECIFNTEGQFGWPAYAGMLVPLTTAVFVLTMSRSLGIVMLCIGTVVGLCLQLGVFSVRARRARLVYRPILDLRNSEIGTIINTAWPVLVGALIGQAINLIDLIFASFLPSGSISSLNYALKLTSVFTGVIFMSVGRAILPYLSHHIALNDMKGFKAMLRLYIWIVGIGITLLSVLVILLAHPLVQLLFQRGAFTANDTNRTASILIGFAVGLTPMAFGFIAFRAFSALGKTRMLMSVTLCSLFANAVFDYIFSRLWQAEGIALSTSISYFFSMFILFFALRRIIGDLHIFTPPTEIVDILQRLSATFGLSHRGVQRRNIVAVGNMPGAIRNEAPSPLLHNPYGLQQQIRRFGIIIAVFTIGVIGVFLNSLYALRAALGSVIMLALMRYPYVLLITWVLINAINALPVFRGSNILVGLTVPTLLLMTCMPIKRTFKVMPALAFLGVFLLWVFAGIGISPIGVGEFLTQWVLLVDGAAIAILTVNVLITHKRVLGTIDAILLLSLFIALYGIYGYITKQNGTPDPADPSLFRIASIFAPIAPTLAMFLSLVIPLALYRSFTLQGFKRFIALIVVLIFVVTLGLTFTRAAYISVALSIIIMIFFLPSPKLKLGLLGGSLLLFIIAVLLETLGHFPVFERFFGSDITSLNGRTYLWQAVLANFDPTRLLGYGLRASDVLLTNLQVSLYGLGIIGQSPHSLFLGTLYDNGIIGLILLVLVFIVLIANLIKGMRKTTGHHQALFVTVFAILVSVLAQSLQTNDFSAQAFNVYFWIVMALPFAFYWSTSKQPQQTSEDLFDSEATEPRMKAIQLVGERRG